jgi:hypothetical protein
MRCSTTLAMLPPPSECSEKSMGSGAPAVRRLVNPPLDFSAGIGRLLRPGAAVNAGASIAPIFTTPHVPPMQVC